MRNETGIADVRNAKELFFTIRGKLCRFDVASSTFYFEGGTVEFDKLKVHQLKRIWD